MSAHTESGNSAYYQLDSFMYSNTLPVEQTLSTPGKNADIIATLRQVEASRGYRKFRDRLLRLQSTSWTFEVLSIVASLAMLIAMIIIIWKWEDRPSASYDMSITLNTLVLVLSLASKLLMLTSLLSCVGQLRWIRAKRGISLESFYLLDLSSRGPLGALRAIFSGVDLATFIGSTAVILTLAFEAFSRQAISTSSPNQVNLLIGKGLPFDNPASSTFSNLTTGNAVDLMWVLTQTSAAWSARRDNCSVPSESFLAPSTTLMACADGPCTSRKYGSFELCASCDQTTGDLQQDCSSNNGTCRWTSPSGITLDNSTQRFVLNTSYQPVGYGTGLSKVASDIVSMEAIEYFNASNLRWDPTFGPAPDITPRIESHSCMISVCSSEYETWQEDATSTPLERRLYTTKTTALLTEDKIGFSGSLGAGRDWPYENLTIKKTTMDDFLKSTFSRIFSGQLPIAGNDPSTFFSQAGGTIFWEQVYAAALSIGRGQGPDDDTEEAPIPDCINYGNGLNLILVYLTAYLRNTYGFTTSLNTGKHIADTALAVPKFVVRWPWLILPLALQAVTLLFMLYVMIQSHRLNLPLWRHSLLASMYHGIDVNEHVGGTNLQTLEDMERVAARTTVGLGQTSTGYRLVYARDSQSSPGELREDCDDSIYH